MYERTHARHRLVAQLKAQQSADTTMGPTDRPAAHSRSQSPLQSAVGEDSTTQREGAVTQNESEQKQAATDDVATRRSDSVRPRCFNCGSPEGKDDFLEALQIGCGGSGGFPYYVISPTVKHLLGTRLHMTSLCNNGTHRNKGRGYQQTLFVELAERRGSLCNACWLFECKHSRRKPEGSGQPTADNMAPDGTSPTCFNCHTVYGGAPIWMWGKCFVINTRGAGAAKVTDSGNPTRFNCHTAETILWRRSGKVGCSCATSVAYTNATTHRVDRQSCHTPELSGSLPGRRTTPIHLFILIPILSKAATATGSILAKSSQYKTDVEPRDGQCGGYLRVLYGLKGIYLNMTDGLTPKHVGVVDTCSTNGIHQLNKFLTVVRLSAVRTLVVGDMGIVLDLQTMGVRLEGIQSRERSDTTSLKSVESWINVGVTNRQIRHAESWLGTPAVHDAGSNQPIRCVGISICWIVSYRVSVKGYFVGIYEIRVVSVAVVFGYQCERDRKTQIPALLQNPALAKLNLPFVLAVKLYHLQNALESSFLLSLALELRDWILRVLSISIVGLEHIHQRGAQNERKGAVIQKGDGTLKKRLREEDMDGEGLGEAVKNVRLNDGEGEGKEKCQEPRRPRLRVWSGDGEGKEQEAYKHVTTRERIKMVENSTKFSNLKFPETDSRIRKTAEVAMTLCSVSSFPDALTNQFEGPYWTIRQEVSVSMPVLPQFLRDLAKSCEIWLPGQTFLRSGEIRPELTKSHQM
ncbi:hypothetical protein FB45DRAFT_870525 [Roridomyces roridus]|uniref:Uncharacterized protein n=1 Tax=Roridomyces roridus TaxID=1738132 RepID=A0AAD7FJE6_9AGAR|nr:hypothetical protein FB45DRAFT_870525 [Roridomyces roridus]